VNFLKPAGGSVNSPAISRVPVWVVTCTSKRISFTAFASSFYLVDTPYEVRKVKLGLRDISYQCIDMRRAPPDSHRSSDYQDVVGSEIW
jgi:hypothetical protein